MATETKPLITRRTALKGVGGIGAGLALSGLAAPGLRAQATRPIRFLNAETGKETLAFFDKAVAEYKDKTGIEVIVDSVPLGDSFTKITNGIRAGTPYDIATVGFIGQVLILAQQGQILPLNELTDQYEWGSNILFPIDGKVYWYPYDYNLAMIYYRKDLYEKNNLSIPDTWSAFVDNCKATIEGRRKGCLFPIGSNGAANWMSFAFMWAEGVKLFDDQFNVILDSEEMKPKVASYLDFMAQLYPTMPPGAIQAGYSTVLSNLVAGTIAHGAYSGRVYESAERTNPEMAENLGIMPYMDSKGQQKAASLGYDGWMLLNTDNKGPAMDFLRWLTTEKFVDFLHTAPMNFQPTRLDIYDNQQWRDNPMIEKFSDTVELMYKTITDPSIVIKSIDTTGPRPDVRPGKVFQSFALPEMLQNKLIRGMASDEAVDTAATRIREVIS